MSSVKNLVENLILKRLNESNLSEKEKRIMALKSAMPLGGSADPKERKLIDKLEKEGLVDIVSIEPLDNFINYELTNKGKSLVKSMKESLINESDYHQVNHKSFTDAVNTAKEKAENLGYVIDEDEWFRKVSTGPRKPGKDKTNTYSIELLTKKGNNAKKLLHFQVYNTGGSYELNAYIN